MPGIVPEDYAVQLHCEALQRNIRANYADALAAADGKARAAIERAMHKEIKQALSAYLKAHPAKPPRLGSLIH